MTTNPTPHPTEIRTMLEKAAKLMGYDTSHYWNEERALKGIDALVVTKDRKLVNTGWDPATSAHDSRMLAIQAEIVPEHDSDCVWAHGPTKSRAEAYPVEATLDEKLQCELLAVLKCAAAIQDERKKL